MAIVAPAPPDAAAQTTLLLPQHADLTRGSAIADGIATAGGYCSVRSARELAALGFAASQQRAPAMVIPIWDVHGRVALHQCRPDEPRETNGKAVKYETPVGRQLVIDVPPATPPHLADSTRPLWITEGSRKADAAASIGLHCVALIGVWGWGRGQDEQG